MMEAVRHGGRHEDQLWRYVRSGIKRLISAEQCREQANLDQVRFVNPPVRRINPNRKFPPSIAGRTRSSTWPSPAIRRFASTIGKGRGPGYVTRWSSYHDNRAELYLILSPITCPTCRAGTIGADREASPLLVTAARLRDVAARAAPCRSPKLNADVDLNMQVVSIRISTSPAATCAHCGR